MKRVPRVLWAILAVALVVPLAACEDDETTLPEQPDYSFVGSDVCGTCHTDIHADFVQSAHPYKLNKVEDGIPLGHLSSGQIGIEEALLGLEDALVHLPSVQVRRESISRIRAGAQPADSDLYDPNPDFEGDYVALTDEVGMIFGIAKRSDMAGALLRIERIL